MGAKGGVRTKPRAKPAKVAAPAPKPAAAPPKPNRTKKPRPSQRGLLRRVGHWTAVVAIVGVGTLALMVAYYASRLPPMAAWTVPQRPPNVRILADNGALISNDGDYSGASV